MSSTNISECDIGFSLKVPKIIKNIYLRIMKVKVLVQIQYPTALLICKTEKTPKTRLKTNMLLMSTEYLRTEDIL